MKIKFLVFILFYLNSLCYNGLKLELLFWVWRDSLCFKELETF